MLGDLLLWVYVECGYTLVKRNERCIPGILPILPAMLENVRSLSTNSNLVPGHLTIIAKQVAQ